MFSVSATLPCCALTRPGSANVTAVELLPDTAGAVDTSGALMTMLDVPTPGGESNVVLVPSEMLTVVLAVVPPTARTAHTFCSVSGTLAALNPPGEPIAPFAVKPAPLPAAAKAPVAPMSQLAAEVL